MFEKPMEGELRPTTRIVASITFVLMVVIVSYGVYRFNCSYCLSSSSGHTIVELPRYCVEVQLPEFDKLDHSEGGWATPSGYDESDLEEIEGPAWVFRRYGREGLQMNGYMPWGYKVRPLWDQGKAIVEKWEEPVGRGTLIKERVVGHSREDYSATEERVGGVPYGLLAPPYHPIQEFTVTFVSRQNVRIPTKPISIPG